MQKKHLFHVLLFVITFASTTLIQGPVYGLTIMVVLLAHELGHHLQCRRHGVAATLPFFIPFPNIFGTMGAVIAMRSPIPNRRALFDIGVTGPLVGLLLALVAVALGLKLSAVSPITTETKGLWLGEPPLFAWLRDLIVGPVPAGSDVFLHPIAFAGWAAIFVTAINFFPVGQLDGGHVVYAMVGRRTAKLVSGLVMAVLFYLGYHYQPMWYFFLVIVLLVTMRRPAPVDDVTPIDGKRKLLGLLTFLLMAACFSPVPFDVRP